MSDNRDYIDESSLVRVEQLLDKGIPIFFLAGKYQVKEGFCAVLTEGGVYRETLGPGFYYLNKYKFFRDLRATIVDLRTKSLSIETKRKYQIRYPIPIQIDLDLSVEYKVTDPRIVALEYEEPLKALFDRVNQAIDPIMSVATHDEVLSRRNEFAQRILRSVQSEQYGRSLGIEVKNIIVTHLKALDAGKDAIGQRQAAEMNRIRDAQIEAYILQNSPMDMRIMLLQASPDQRIELLKEIADQGYLSSEGMTLYAPSNMSGQSGNQALMGLLGGGNFGGVPGQYPGQNQYGGGFGQQGGMGGMGGMPGQYQGSAPQLPGGTVGIGQQPGGQNRMVTEVNYLKTLPGADVQIKTGKDSNGLPTGDTHIMVTLPKVSGGTITCYFCCDSNFPNTPPFFSVEVDGFDYPFESATMRTWRGNYLIEIVREVLSGVG